MLIFYPVKYSPKYYVCAMSGGMTEIKLVSCDSDKIQQIIRRLSTQQHIADILSNYISTGMLRIYAQCLDDSLTIRF